MQIASRQCLWKDTTSARGTILAVEASSACMTVRIASGKLAAGSTSVTVDWGDGEKSKMSKIDAATHAYARAGEYRISISDDLSSFGFADYSSTAEERDMLRELVNLGPRVTQIESYCFNNCHLMRGVMNLPGVTEIGAYAFGSTRGITDYIMPSMKRLRETSFYRGSSPVQMHADNVTEIGSQFWDYYGWKLYDLYLRSATCARIAAMAGFPFKADQISQTVRFHGSDGIVTANGEFIQN